ncbi:MAG: hypothetical protein RBU21_01340 [FCB group bacterium]|jgi:hypothetical protein|nr:hypothetical protein [FCB group bacterium]
MRIAICLLVAAALPWGGAWAEDPWADAVVAYAPVNPMPGYADASKALGEPVGGGLGSPTTASLVSLGSQGGTLTLRFNTPVADDPLNPMGLDCVVYSNAFWAGGNKYYKFQEPALIEISEDVNGNGLADDPWYLIPGSRAFAYSPFPAHTEPAGQDNKPPMPPDLMAGNIVNANTLDADPANNDLEHDWGYAELSPTASKYLDNYMRPDDPLTVGLLERSGGGDAFDIAWAIDSTGAAAHLTRFHFIRLTCFINRLMGVLGPVSPDIDAVADVAPDIDNDGDGILDEYETRVAGTDPQRGENTLLPLEIPPHEGGSPVGTLLGTAQDARGTILRLYAAAERTGATRAMSTVVDLGAPADPGGNLPDANVLKSAAVREVTSSATDFVGAGIAPALVTVQYRADEIVGLDEESLRPYRRGTGGYTSDGITEVAIAAAGNVVSFRTRYAGVFVLGAPAGSGDSDDGSGPQGAIVLTASPPGEAVVGSAGNVHVVSQPLRDALGEIVEDGVQVTVATSGGTITTADANATLPGVQVETVGGIVAFDLSPSTVAGSILISATSTTGAAYGELTYTFAPGPPAAPLGFHVVAREGTGPVDLTVRTDVVRDEYGNTVRDGTLLTLVIANGTVMTGDADDAVPGFQAALNGGRATFIVRVPGEGDAFHVTAYGDPEQISELGGTQVSTEDYVAMPLTIGAMLVMALAALGLRQVKQRS